LKKSKHQLFGCITPLCFNFEDKLQELLIKTCKLSDKSLKIHIKELFENEKYEEIVEEDCLELLIRDELEEILGRKRKNGEVKDDLVNNIKKMKFD